MIFIDTGASLPIGMSSRSTDQARRGYTPAWNQRTGGLHEPGQTAAQGPRGGAGRPELRALSGTAAGTLIASAAGPVYRAIHDHFTLSGNDLAAALGDSFSRGLTAIDDELNGWRISQALGSKLRRDYQARIRSDFLDPYAAEHGLDDANRKALCRTLNQHSARLIEARERLFPAAELPEPDIAELLSTDAGGIGELLLERIDLVTDPLPEDLRGFLIYRDLIGDSVLYFFRETLRRDPRVETTLNALQQAGLRQDSQQLQQQLHALHAQQAQLQDALTEALQARDRTRRNELMEQIDRLDDLLADVQVHQQRQDAFRQQFSDWSVYLDVRLDELQQANDGLLMREQMAYMSKLRVMAARTTREDALAVLAKASEDPPASTDTY